MRKWFRSGEASRSKLKLQCVSRLVSTLSVISGACLLFTGYYKVSASLIVAGASIRLYIWSGPDYYGDWVKGLKRM